MFNVLLKRMQDTADECDEMGDTGAAEAVRSEIEQVKRQIEEDRAAEHRQEDPLPRGLFERVEFRARRKPFRPGVLDDYARCTEEEMAANIAAVSEDALGKDAATHTLCYHFTTLTSLDLIMGGKGLRASPYGQLNGGLGVCLADMSELNWQQWSGNRFRENVGKELWGEKWRDLLRKGKGAGGVDVVSGPAGVPCCCCC